MATAIGDLVVRLGASSAGFDRTMRNAQGTLRHFQTAMGSAAAKVAGFIGAAVGIKKAFDGLTFGIRLAAQMEQAEVAFGTMLGSSKKAKAVLADINRFAASTPFELPGLVDASRKLLAFGTPAEELISVLRRVGDVSAGVGAPIEELAELYGKAQVSGRLFAEDINQLTGRGIPIIGELAKQFGVAESAVKQLVEKGQVNFGHLEAAFESLTSKGGKFAGLMDAQSKTLGGLWSTLRDNVGAALRTIGETVISTLRLKSALESGISVIGRLTEWLQQIPALLESPMLRAAGAFVKVVALGGTVVGAIVGITAAASAAGPALAAAFTLATGPIGLVIAGITALGAAIIQVMGEGDTFTAKMQDVFGNQLPAILEGALFYFRNFAAVSELAILDIVHAGLTMFPQLEGPIARVAAFFVGTWAGVKAFFGTWLEGIKGGFLELANMAKAVAAGIASAFAALRSGNFRGIGAAFADSFMKTLAAQENVHARNPFAEFGSAFTSAQADLLKQIERAGGVTSALDARRQELLRQIAERERVVIPAALESVTESAPAKAAEAASKADEEDKTHKTQFAGAMERGTTEAWSTVLAAIGAGGKDRDKEKKLLDKIADATKRTAEAVSKGEEVIEIA